MEIIKSETSADGRKLFLLVAGDVESVEKVMIENADSLKVFCVREEVKN